MSRLTARIRQLEAGLRPGECHVCGTGARVIVWVDDEQPDYEQPMCIACGQPRLVFVWDMRSGDELPRSQQVPTATTHPSSGPAERVATPNRHGAVTNGPNARAESQSKPRVRRRQYSG